MYSLWHCLVRLFLLGSHFECQYELVSFGIPQKAIQVTQEGKYLTDQHMIWFERRREIEAERALLEMRNGVSNMKNEDSAEGETFASQPWSRRVMLGLTPRPEDVLFGRGKTVVEHPGNIRFRQVVDLYMLKYTAAIRTEKTRITEGIMHMVQGSAGRFLRRDDGMNWEEVDDATAREKVAHAFRNRRKFHGNLGKKADL
jgi:hypothetical protein